MAVTFLFPGQGSQKVGMGKSLYEQFPEARARFDEANEILGRNITALCFEGPESDLRATQNTQPSLFVVEAALTDVLRSKGLEPSYTAGHSLGEYAALYAAGVVSFSDGLQMVAKRGALMAEAGKSKPGTMAAVIGLPIERIRETLEDVKAGVVVSANQNSPEQTVISGEVEAVEQACEALKAAGAKRAVPLPVSGAFHSPLMADAAREFGAVVAEVAFSAPVCPVLTNVSAQPEREPGRLRELLIDQLTSPVRWVEIVENLRGLDYGRCLEVGPGSVLKGLVRACAPEVTVTPCGTAENVYSVILSCRPPVEGQRHKE